MEFNVITTPYQNGVIEQELYQKTEDQGRLMARWVVDTRDADIEKALIALGWVPPNQVDAIDTKAPCRFCEQDGASRMAKFCPQCGRPLR